MHTSFRRRSGAVCLFALALLSLPLTLHARTLDSVRLRGGSAVDLGDINGGAVALTFSSDHSPAFMYWLGDDLHYETAFGVWHDAGIKGDEIYTAHIGPVWHYEPDFLGSRTLLELGTSIAWVSDERVEQRDLGSRWQFTSHALIGFYLDSRKRWHAGLRVRHTSNAGFAEPNPGLNIVLFEIGYRL